MVKRLLAFAIFGLILVPFALAAVADDCAPKDISERIACYEAKLNENKGQQQTLSSAISYLDSKIALTLTQIEKTEIDIASLEEEVATLVVKINRLDINLTDISKLLVSRVGESYKRTLFNPGWQLLSAGGLTEYLEQSTYLASAQQNDRKLLLELQNAKDTSEAQKALKEQKQLELENLQKQLASQNSSLLQQKGAKADLLRQTKNDEKTYQQLLATAQAEYQAIQAIIANKGKETEAGHVNAGDKIASMIQGASCNSSGTHVHFIVSENTVSKNPFDYLSGGIDWVDNSGGDQFNPHGSWSWPINPRVRFNQGYGVTWFVSTYHWYPFHNGIDLSSDSGSTVKAVKPGTLYKGSYVGFNGCTLPYVRVDHDENSLDTLYLHVIY